MKTIVIILLSLICCRGFSQKHVFEGVMSYDYTDANYFHLVNLENDLKIAVKRENRSKKEITYYSSIDSTTFLLENKRFLISETNDTVARYKKKHYLNQNNSHTIEEVQHENSWLYISEGDTICSLEYHYYKNRDEYDLFATFYNGISKEALNVIMISLGRIDKRIDMTRKMASYSPELFLQIIGIPLGLY